MIKVSRENLEYLLRQASVRDDFIRQHDEQAMAHAGAKLKIYGEIRGIISSAESRGMPQEEWRAMIADLEHELARAVSEANLAGL